jgi:hypothetical protein
MKSLFKSATITLICILLFGCVSKTPPKITEEERQSKAIALQKANAEFLERQRIVEKEKLRISEYRKNAGNRNSAKIKSLGFPLVFTNSTININFVGTWAPSGPVNQWLGLMLENRKIQALEKFSYQGNPGVFISEIGKPKIGLIFRVEEIYAYPHAIQILGKTELVKIDQHLNFMNIMLSYTSQSDLDMPKPIEKKEGDLLWSLLHEKKSK